MELGHAPDALNCGIGYDRRGLFISRITLCAHESHGAWMAYSSRALAGWTLGISCIRAKAIIAHSSIMVPRRIGQPHSATAKMPRASAKDLAPTMDFAHDACNVFSRISARGATMRSSLPYKTTGSMRAGVSTAIAAGDNPRDSTK